MNKIGIITYHAAYNYGSVLQAFATQEAISKIGFDSEIINYRFREQKNIYAMYRIHCGLRKFIKDLLLVPIHIRRSVRVRHFEEFIAEYLNLSDEFSKPEEAVSFFDTYDTLLSGSDQIWNKHSLELENVGWEYMYPYLFHGINNKKISYASSIANMKDSELEFLREDIKDFAFLSVRESTDVQRLASLTCSDVAWVVDPTFLMTKDEWIKRLRLRELNEAPYLFFYSLSVGYSELKEDIRLLKQFANLRKLKVKIVNPYIYVKNDDVIELVADCGPKEFLELVYNASVVITDSYHGTVLSINFEKEVFSICGEGRAENRKKDVLLSLGMEKCAIDGLDKLQDSGTEINYDLVRDKLEKRRHDSFDYLIHALEKEVAF